MQQEQSSTTEQTETKCLKSLLSGTIEKAKVGEFQKTAETKLAELAGGVEQEEQKYRDEIAGFRTTWKEHDEKICGIKKHLCACYADWDIHKGVICKEVILKVWKLREKLDGSLGPPQKCLDAANADFEKAEKQLEAWKTITTWIKARLEHNTGLIEEICKLDSCTDRLFALYIFYFELLPLHEQLKKPPSELSPELLDPERAYCGSECGAPPPESGVKMCGFPWLITPNDYDCKLAEVWKIWRQAGVAQAEAQCKVDEIEKCREEYEAAKESDAKREAAREALRRYDERNGCTSSLNNQSQQPQMV